MLGVIIEDCRALAYGDGAEGYDHHSVAPRIVRN